MLALIALMVWPLIPVVPHDMLSTAILTCDYLVVALSLVLLIGLVGQISLAQASFVGVGAFTAALATQKLRIHFPYTLLVGTLAGGGLALLLGAVALRVRGLYLAVATMIFAWICDQYLFVQPWLVTSPSGTSIPREAIGQKGSFPYFDLTDAHIFYYIALAVAVATFYALANLRDSRVGRAFAAIRGSEVAAASLGIAVTRFKLIGFGIAGAMAGLGGSLLLAGNETVNSGQFNFQQSLFFLSVAVVGGLRSLGGALGASLIFALMVGEVFFRYPAVASYLDLVSAGLLIAVLLFFRGGLGAIPEKAFEFGPRARPRAQRALDLGTQAVVTIRALVPAQFGGFARALGGTGRALSRAILRVRPPEPADEELLPVDVVELVRRLNPTRGAVVRMEPAQDTGDARAVRRLLVGAAGEGSVAGEQILGGRRQPVLLRADHITVRFGGLTAVDDASLEVGAGEIIGLIGPNGAGKTTLFNSILGLNQPTSGTVSLMGKDVTAWPVHKRAALGVGRTFQILQLFGDLTVAENLLVGTHLQNSAGLIGGIFASTRAQRAERAARARVRAVLRLLELESVADRRVAGLPFGVLRLVEVARTLVTGSRLVCFDEPASGLDSAETEGLIEWFRVLRQIGITLLVIEHDVDMVTRLCDFIYVLDQGKLIAAGTPTQIQRDPAVVASYLGSVAEAS